MHHTPTTIAPQRSSSSADILAAGSAMIVCVLYQHLDEILHQEPLPSTLAFLLGVILARLTSALWRSRPESFANRSIIRGPTMGRQHKLVSASIASPHPFITTCRTPPRAQLRRRCKSMSRDAERQWPRSAVQTDRGPMRSMSNNGGKLHGSTDDSKTPLETPPLPSSTRRGNTPHPTISIGAAALRAIETLFEPSVIEWINASTSPPLVLEPNPSVPTPTHRKRRSLLSHNGSPRMDTIREGEDDDCLGGEEEDYSSGDDDDDLSWEFEACLRAEAEAHWVGPRMRAFARRSSCWSEEAVYGCRGAPPVHTLHETW